MPEPIEYLVLTNLQTALKAITVGAGFFFTVAAAAVKLDPNQAAAQLVPPGGARPYIVIEVRPERWEYFAASEVRLVLPWTIHWVHTSDPTVDESLMQTYFRGCADIEQAIAKDMGRGGYAIDTRIVKREREIDEDGSEVWAMVDIEIALRRTYGQPNA